MKHLFNKNRKVAIRIALLLLIFIIVILGFKYVNSNKKNGNTLSTELNSETWSLFTSEQGNFKMLFPIPNPKLIANFEVPLANTDLKHHQIQYCENDAKEDNYCTEVGIYPPSFKLRNDSYNLNLYKNDILQNYKNSTLVNSYDGQFLGYPSIDFVLKTKDFYYKYRIFSIEDNTYGVSVASINSDFLTFDKFANSFSILKFKYNNLSWKPLVSKEWNFKMLFPNDSFTTEVTTPNDQVSKGVTYSSNPNNRASYSMTISKWRSDINLHSLLNDTLEILNSNLSMSYKIISSKDLTCSKKTCLIFLAQENDSKEYDNYKGAVILGDNNTTYFIYGIVDNEKYFSNIDKIINSFVLTPQ